MVLVKIKVQQITSAFCRAPHPIAQKKTMGSILDGHAHFYEN